MLTGGGSSDLCLTLSFWGLGAGAKARNFRKQTLGTLSFKRVDRGPPLIQLRIREHLLCARHWLSPSYALASLYSPNTLWGGYYYSHVTDEKIEARRGQLLPQGHTDIEI